MVHTDASKIAKRRIIVLLATGLACWLFGLLFDVTRYGERVTVSIREGALKIYWGDDQPGIRNASLWDRQLWPAQSASSDEAPGDGSWEIHSGILFRLSTVDSHRTV